VPIFFSRLFLIVMVTLFAASCSVNWSKRNGTIRKENEIKILATMADIKAHLPEVDLVIFDIDHTILEAKTAFCHSNWFYDQYEEAKALGINEEKVLAALLPPWEKAQLHCEVKAVEPFTPALIREIQESKIKVMALTSRSQRVAEETIAQLQSLGIDFSNSAPVKGDFSVDSAKQVLSKSGIVFTTDYLTKGDVLKHYLERAPIKPRRILFVDDSWNNLISVSQVLSAESISVQAFHYPLVKRSLPYWDREYAKLEWEKRFGKLDYQ
jgi:FMN phosphatase YigB (HAD superfamily)